MLRLTPSKSIVVPAVPKKLRGLPEPICGHER